MKGDLVIKGVVAITLKCVRSQVQFLLGVNNLEIATPINLLKKEDFIWMAIDTNVTAPVNVTGAPITNTVANHAENQKNSMDRILKGQPSNAQAVQAVEAWKHSDFLCHSYVLNGLVDSLYNMYCKTTTAKELWESLERKYKTEDASTKKFVVLLHKIHAEGMTVSEAFQVAAIIEKLPPSWVDFKNYLKHKRKEMSVEDLIVRLCIKEDNKLAQKNTYTPDSAKANMVEHAGSSLKSNSKAKGNGKKNDKKGKGKAEYLAPKAGIVKQKFQGTCYNYDQPGHRAANCKMPKRVNPRQANMVNDNMDMIAMVSDVIAMISEVNLVGSNNSGWWVDTGATRHVCADKSMFHSFRAVDNGEKLYMGNSATVDIKGEGDVILKMTSEKELKLTNSDKFVLSKNQMYVGKGYALNGMFKLNVMVVMNNINKMNSSAYLIESSNVWHGRLGHETGSSSRLDDEVVQDKRQQDYNDLHDERQDQLEKEEVEPRRSKRARTEKRFGPDFVSFMVENKPTSYREAVTSSEGHQWKEAIKSEIDSILQNHTWELVDLPPGCKPLGYKWIFKKKVKVDGTIDKYKARLVIKGYRQCEGLDYFDTYSSVTRITSIRMVLAIAALKNLEVHQMDVKMAFLSGYLEEEIYINKPKGFIAPGQEIKVCRLVKSLYGLKQAPKQWHQKFDHTMLESGFKINECDKCVYVKDTSSGYVILCLYVDDMLIISSNDKMFKSTKDMLKLKFDMKDMGLADVILGIKIIRTHNELVLSQAHYVDKILKTHNAGDSGLARTPIDTSMHVSKNRGVGVAQLEYSRIIGMLMYLMTSTRPDLAYAVSRLSWYTSNPSVAHWKAMTRVLHYLRYSRDYRLHYDRHHVVIEGYNNANWISDIKDSRSTSGYVFTLGGPLYLGSLPSKLL
ncbi:retrovirus-related pol polyprotein from transposon TNT 1-94 [Tanacetum coccineum]